MIVAAICLSFVLLSVKYPIFIVGVFLLLLFFIFKKSKIGIIISSISVLLGVLLILINAFDRGEFASEIGIIISRSDNYYIFASLKGNYYVYENEHLYEIGDVLKIEGHLKEIVSTSLEGEFSFKDYLFGKNVDYQLHVKDVDIIFENPFSRVEFIKNYYQLLNEESGYLIGNIFFNSSNRQYDGIFNKLGISYLLSLSNIYLYLFFHIIERLIKLINKKESKNASKYALLFLLPLLFLSRYKLGFIKTFLILFNKVFLDRKYDNEDIVSILLICILIFNPRYVFSTSFIYIFVLFYVRSYIFKVIKVYDGLDKKMMNIIVFSLLYGTLNIMFNGCFNLFTSLYQTIGVLLFELLFILTILSFVFQPLTIIINILAKLYINLFSILSTFSLPLYYNQVILCVIIVFILLFIYCYLSELYLIKQAKMLLLISYLVIGGFALPIDSFLSSYIVFINVGQGDSILIHHRDIDILIDTGGSLYKDIAQDVLIPYFKKNHIYDIDYLFITHDDYDHSGAFDSLYSSFIIKDYFIGSNFINKKIGDISFENLNIYNTGIHDNDESSVLYFNFLNMNFLLMGDASIDIEEKIISNRENLSVDILKLGHHGSLTSSSLKFLQTVKPKEAIISCEYNNKYNHPHDIVLKRLSSLNIKVRRTDIEGSIIYKKSI